MSTITGSSITEIIAKEQIDNWIGLRDSLPFTTSFLGYPHSYQITSGFEPSYFENDVAHAYFGIEISDENAGQVQMIPSLLFIPGSQDKEDYSGQRYIYRAPFLRDEDLVKPPSDQISAQVAIDMINYWSQHRENWINYMTNESLYGLTLVSVVPFTDLTSNFNDSEGLKVRLGLHTDHIDPAKNLGLLFFNGSTDDYISLIADDITTPKPPFGIDDQNEFYLIRNYLNQ